MASAASGAGALLAPGSPGGLLRLLADGPGALPPVHDGRPNGTGSRAHGGHVLPAHDAVGDALLMAPEPPRAVGRHGPVPLVVIVDVRQVGLEVAGHVARRAGNRERQRAADLGTSSSSSSSSSRCWTWSLGLFLLGIRVLGAGGQGVLLLLARVDTRHFPSFRFPAFFIPGFFVLNFCFNFLFYLQQKN